MPKVEDALMDAGEKIEQAARKFGLYVQDLKIYLVSEEQMLAPLALDGSARRYAHWSFGKKAEIFNRQIREGGINASSLDLLLLYSLPSLPILVSEPLYKQVSAIARAYAHMDFMHQNSIWKARDFDEMRRGMEEHSRFINGLIRNPLVGRENVEQVLTAAHSVAYQCSHTRALSGRVSDFLLELAEHAPKLEQWRRDLLRIVHEEWLWFLPVIETHFMLKGWINFWQMKLIKEANLSDELYWRCLLESSQEVEMPDLGTVNPSIVGYTIFEGIFKKECQQDTQVFRRNTADILQQESDVSFIEKFLTQETAELCGLFSFGQRGTSGGDDKILEVKELSDPRGWEGVRDELISWIGGNEFPVIRITENSETALRLEHQFEGRPLDHIAFKGVLAHLRDTLHRDVALVSTSIDVNGNEVKTETTFNGKGGDSTRSLNPPANQDYDGD